MIVAYQRSVLIQHLDSVGADMRTTVRLLTAGLLLTLTAGFAGAQTYTGAYGGIQSGYRWSNATAAIPDYSATVGGTTFNVTGGSESFASQGPVMGGHAGYNGQFGAVLIGVEGDFDGGFQSSSAARTLSTTVTTPDIQTCVDNGDFGFTCTTTPGMPTTTTAIETHRLDIGAQGTIRGRAGLVTGNTLIFGTGGLALSEIDWTDTLTSGGVTATASSQGVRTGWVAGGGFETFVAANLIFRTDYLYEDFGSFNVPLAGSAATASLHPVVQKIRTGWSFKF